MTAEPIEHPQMQAYGARKDSRLCGWGLFVLLWPIWKAVELRGYIIDKRNERSGL